MKRNTMGWRYALLVLLLSGGSAWTQGPQPSKTPAANQAGHEAPIAEFQAVAKKLEDSGNDYFGWQQVRQLQATLDNPNLPPRQEMIERFRLSLELLRVAQTKRAIDEMEKGFRLAGKLPATQGGLPPQAHFSRAIVYLRQAENENCVRFHNRDSCLLPLRGGGVHRAKAPAREAKASLLRYLELKPNDLDARWLLNLVSMALGEYPEHMPPRWLIPAKAFESDYDIKRFYDVAGALKVNSFNLAGGSLVDDFNRDGFLDIFTTTWDPRGPAILFINNRKGGFDNRSTESRVAQQLGGLNCVGADYDNDGYRDIFILRGAWLFDDGRIRNSLLHNNADGTFTDVTYEAGVAEPRAPTQAAAWGDFDNDGWVDLYVCNESHRASGDPEGDYPAQLFHNNGDGTFTDIAVQAGVTNDRFCKGTAVGDFNNDGWLDLYTSNGGKNRLYRNNADGTFTDVAEELGVIEPTRRSFASWFFDFNNDGWLDIFVVGYLASNADLAADYLGLPHKATLPRLYRNDGGDGFTDVTRQVGLARPFLPMGCSFGDIDQDGFLDIYLGTGEPAYKALMPNVMLRNDGGKRFQDVSTSGGFGHLQKGHGISFADIDNDGDQDIYVQLGGFYPGDRFRNALYKNPGHGHHFLHVTVEGRKTNRAGFGVRIKVVVETADGDVAFHRAVGSFSSFGSAPMRQEIGLGNAIRIKKLEINWPTSRTTQVFADVPLDSWIHVEEGTSSFDRVELKRFSLP